MRDFIIFGKGDFADILTYIIEKEMRRNVAAYTVNKTFLDTNQYRGKRVVPWGSAEHGNRAMCSEGVFHKGPGSRQ